MAAKLKAEALLQFLNHFVKCFDTCQEIRENKILKILRTYLHLGRLDGEFVIFPVVPSHSLVTDVAV